MRSARLIVVLSAMASLLSLAACNTSPAITDASIMPNSFTISGLASNAQFVLSCNVLHFGGTVTKVVATVEGQSELGPYDLTEGGSVAGGNSWSISTTLTLPSGFADGTYKIDIAATDSDGTTTTQTDATELTISG